MIYWDDYGIYPVIKRGLLRSSNFSWRLEAGKVVYKSAIMIIMVTMMMILNRDTPIYPIINPSEKYEFVS